MLLSPVTPFQQPGRIAVAFWASVCLWALGAAIKASRTRCWGSKRGTGVGMGHWAFFGTFLGLGFLQGVFVCTSFWQVLGAGRLAHHTRGIHSANSLYTWLETARLLQCR
jgi:hypothetical protein